MTRRLRAPAGDGELLADPGFDAVPAAVERNRRLLDAAAVRIDGLALSEFRAAARAEILSLVESLPVATGRLSPPLLLAGHQPELSHPGVWVKNFALSRLARRVGGVALNLVVDTDTMKSPALPVPAWDVWQPSAVRVRPVPLGGPPGERPYETASPADEAAFAAVPRQVAALTRHWGYEPVLAKAWAAMPPTGTFGERFVAARRHFEREWGCDNRELRVSQLSNTDAFRRFARHVVGDLPRFADAYNRAVGDYRRRHKLRSQSHPVPDLADGEAPFWGPPGPDGRRTRPAGTNGLRPRALTLTLFARVCLGDFFMHGIGGGIYDEVTDALIRDYLGLDPPAYQVVSATLRLPLPRFPGTPADVAKLERLDRDLHWNPHRYLPSAADRHADVMAMPTADRRGRRAQAAAFRRLADELRPHVQDRVTEVEADLDRTRREAAANAVLAKRDYPWVLYPEATLREFLAG